MKDFADKLLFWYKKNTRDLPWRKTRDPYKIWISEVMLQQTTVNAVIPYYKRWIKIFPTIQSVAVASKEKVLKAWQGLGYYQRVRNLQKSAKIISGDYKGRMPDNPDLLKKLPGFGPYTTGAVLSIAFDKKYPIIDANVRRVIMRQLAARGFADPAQDKKIYDFLRNVMPDKEIRFFNQALMELGALICRVPRPLCGQCPVHAGCRAFQERLQDVIPEPRKAVIEKIEAVAAVIERHGRYLIRKRPDKGLLAGMWEFPSVEVQKGELPKKAFERLSIGEFDGRLAPAGVPIVVNHSYTRFQIKLYVWRCRLGISLSLKETYKWIPFSHFKRYPMPSGCAKALDKLKNHS